MKSPRLSTNSSTSSSFALISVLALVSLAALTATAFLASARLERQATMPLTQTTMLDMALDSGSVAALRLLETGAAEQFNYVVTYWRGSRASDWTNELGYLLIGSVQSNDLATNSRKVKYRFCFSSAALTNLATNLIEYIDEESAGNQEQFTRQIKKTLEATSTRTGTNFAAGQFTNIPLLGDTPANRFTSPPVGWVYINQDVRVKPGQTNTTNVPVARFAYYVQDLSSMIDADRMGGETNRSTGTNPAEISLTNLTATALIAPAKVDTLTASTNRPKYLSPGMLVLSNGGGLNTNDLRYVTTGLRHWTNAYERIPLGLGYSNWGTSDRGTNKYNLAINSNIDVDAIAAHITSNLTTNFLVRAGGLTNSILYTNNDFDYAKCLAANIVDYIDPDSIPTALDDAKGYRGTEALPYLTELAMRIRLEQDGTTYSTYNDVVIGGTLTLPTNRIKPSFNLYYEFWNPYNVSIPLSKLTISFKSYGTNSLGNTNGLAMGCNQFVQPIESLATAYQDGASGSLTNMVFDFSTASSTNVVGVSNNALGPNSYCMIRCKNNSDWTNIASSTTNWSFTNNNGTNEYRFIYGNNDTRRFVYVAQLTTNFTNVCIQSNGANISASNPDDPTTGLCELSYSNKTYDRARNLLIRAQDIYAINSPGTDPAWFLWRPGLSIATTENTGDPRITYFLRRSNNTTLHDYTSWANTNGTFGGPNPRLDIPTWPDQGHPPLNFGLASTAEPNSGNVTVTNTGTNRAPGFIRNGPMTNILELGNIYDPILWKDLTNGNITSNSIADPKFGGGNTLRIGRAEHPLFAWTKLGTNANDPSIPNMQMSAAALLDLFCLSNQFDEGGKINLNTAPAPVLRALAGGIYLRSDPNLTAGTVTNANYPIPAEMAEAFAQGVMRFRAKYPFYSPSQLAFIGTATNWPNTNNWPSNAVFGNTNTIFLVTNSVNPLTNTSLGITAWNDQAAEEWFAKLFSLSTVYSRNFRVYVIAQKATNQGGTNIGVGPVVRKYYNLLIRQRGVTNSSEPGAIPTISFQSYY